MSKLIYQNGSFFNEHGSIVYPREKDKCKYLGYVELKKVESTIESSERSFQEFEIHAVAYVNLKKYFRSYNTVRGEYSIRNKNQEGYCYFRCDIAILDKSGKPTLIIEVKKNYNETLHSEGQIEAYKRFAPVYVIDNMKKAENIVKILLEEELITSHWK